MQPPYRQAQRSTREQSEKLPEYLKTGARLGKDIAALYGGSSMISKALPFLVGDMSADRAIAGLKSASPELGKFIEEGLKSGETFDKIKSYIADKFQTAEENQPDSLFRRLVGNIDVSQLDEKTTKELTFFEKIARQLENKGKDEKDPAVKKLKKKIDKALQGMTGMITDEAIAAAPEEEAQQAMAQQAPLEQQAQPQQPGQGQQALMAILQKIQASRGL